MSNKLGVIFYHKNISNIYKKIWIDKCVKSILNQSYKDFKIYEINYGDEDYSVFSELGTNKKEHIFYKRNHINYIESMNFIITEAFNDGCDFVFNTNLDDYYTTDRLEKQLVHLLNGYDIVSSNFCQIKEIDGVDKIITQMNIDSKTNIKENLNKDINVIANPCFAMSKNFWENNEYDIRTSPREDIIMWKNNINKGFKFKIEDKELLYYRIHDNQVSNK
tara:strand:- start:384 stop:1043 length:660 start_codon:yes stop_codon:yes gene_type:complete